MVEARGAAAMARHIDEGRRRIVLRASPSAAVVDGLPTLLAGQVGRTLVVAEHERVPTVLSGLRAALGAPAVDGLDGDARVTVGNYERVGLNARFIASDAFGLVVLLPHGPQNARSAAAVAERFHPAAMLQVLGTGPSAFVPDFSATASDLPPPAGAQDNLAGNVVPFPGRAA